MRVIVDANIWYYLGRDEALFQSVIDQKSAQYFNI